jgi:heme-degrading monooxygenase HmoA/uncharacterized protein YciI
MHYLLFYEVAEDYVARRAQFRDAHLKKAWESSARGELVLGGALANPIDGAVLLFKGDSPGVAENFAKSDPYVTSGIVKRWHVREWTTVAGEEAAIPIRPKSTDPEKATPEPSVAKSAAIVRIWKARATPEKSEEYIDHAARKVFPALQAIEGHRGACLLRRVAAGAVEIVVLTLWESMEAVRRFAGAEPEKAVVEPEARIVLSDFDESVTHFEVVQSSLDTPLRN